MWSSYLLTIVLTTSRLLGSGNMATSQSQMVRQVKRQKKWVSQMYLEEITSQKSVENTNHSFQFWPAVRTIDMWIITDRVWAVSCNMPPCFLFSQYMLWGYSAIQHDIIKTIFHWENWAHIVGKILSDHSLLMSCYILLCSGRAVLMSALSRPNIRGWSQWCLKEWDHFSIDCRVGQCKGHLLWQSGRCCLSACLPVCRPACLLAFILVGFFVSLFTYLSVWKYVQTMSFQRDDEHNGDWSWSTLLLFLIGFSTFGLFLDLIHIPKA